MSTADGNKKPYAFISYRSRDATPYATMLHDRIEWAFGPGVAFLDYRSIPLGANWSDTIEQNLNRSTVILAVIGPKWLESFSPLAPEAPQDVGVKAAKTADDPPRDWVRHELEFALKHNLPVIPVLVGGAERPNPARLPGQLLRLEFRQEISVRDRDGFDRDLKHLLDELQKHYSFRRRLFYRLGAALPFLRPAFFATVFVATALWGKAEGLNAFVTVPLALFINVGVGIAWNLFGQFFGGRVEAPVPRGLRLASAAVLGVSTLFICAFLIAGWTSIFYGHPRDLRNLIQRDLVVRSSDLVLSPFAPENIALAFPDEPAKGVGEGPQTQASMAVFRTWIKNGSQKPGSRVLVYRFEPTHERYYKPVDGQLEFRQLNARAALSAGVAFVVKDAEKPRQWRQVSMWVDPQNAQHEPPNTLANRLSEIQLDPGEKLLVILKFVPLPGADLRPIDEKEFTATPVLRTQ